MKLFKEFEVSREIGGKQVPIKIQVLTDFDDISPGDDFDFGDAEENAKYLKRIQDGEIDVLVIKVKAFALGETGFDILGGCHVCKPQDVDDIVNDHGMVENAIEDLINQMHAKADTLRFLSVHQGGVQ